MDNGFDVQCAMCDVRCAMCILDNAFYISLIVAFIAVFVVSVAIAVALAIEVDFVVKTFRALFVSIGLGQCASGFSMQVSECASVHLLTYSSFEVVALQSSQL